MPEGTIIQTSHVAFDEDYDYEDSDNVDVSLEDEPYVIVAWELPKTESTFGKT